MLAMLAIALCSNAESYAIYVGGVVNSGEANMVETQFANRLKKIRSFELFARNKSFIKSLTKEHDYQLSGEVSESQIRAIGKKYGVNKVVSIQVDNLDDKIFMSATVIDLITGKQSITVSGNREVESSDDLIGLANTVAYKLYNEIK